jgi:hypothetical protein
MKDKAGLIFPLLMMLVGIYVLITAFGSSGEQVNVISDHLIPRGLAMMLGLICLAGGGVVMMTSLSKRKTLS